MKRPVLTIFCAFTRRWAVERWIQNLIKLDYDPLLINLAFIVDIDDPFIASRLLYLEESYRGFALGINRDNNPNEVRPIERRKRIAEVKDQSKSMIAPFYSDYILSFEDDTVFEGLIVERLLEPFYNKEFGEVGMVEGVQCGRWNYKMIGAWNFDNVETPNEVITALPKQDYEEVDAGGFYGYITTKKLYMDHNYHVYPTDYWGPDVNFGLWLRRQGYNNYIDWESKFAHNDHNVLLWPDTDIKQYKMVRNGQDWNSVIP